MKCATKAMLYVLTLQCTKKAIQFRMCMSCADSPREWETLPKKFINLRTGMLELWGKIIPLNDFPFVLLNKISH